MGNLLSCCATPPVSKEPPYSNLTQNSPINEHCRRTNYDSENDGDIGGEIWNDQVEEDFKPIKISPVTSTLTESVPRQKITKSTLNFPFLVDNNTVKQMKKFHTLIIMRGLPGSGKSTITKEIQRIYPEAVLCSADQYFMKDGVYRFSVDGLNAAHQACQKRAHNACENGSNIVVIDNTNIKRWEMKFYLDLAKTYNYVVLMVSPKTEWSQNPEELAKRNSHGVDVDKIRAKLKSFDECIPFYYGWFLNQKDTSQLYQMCKRYLSQNVSSNIGFTQKLLADVDLTGDGLLEYFRLNGSMDKTLHCTSKFMGSFKNPAQDRMEYYQRQDVQMSCGKSFDLYISGIIISQSVVGVRVTFKDEACFDLYDKPEEKERDRLILQKRNLHNEVSNIEDTNPDLVSKVVTNQEYPNRGRSAHITIATANGVPPKQTNQDLLDICDLEQEILDNNSNVIGQKVQGGMIKYLQGNFGEQFCVVYLDEPIPVQGLFTGFY